MSITAQPRVLNKRHHGVPEGAYYIGRPSPLGNPFSHLERSRAEFKVATREEAVSSFRSYALQRPEILKLIRKTRGRDVVCFCSPLSCHGDIVVELANKPWALICGSRDWVGDGWRFVAQQIGALIPHGALVITGGARGIDEYANEFAQRIGHDTVVMPADWNRHGRRAGYLRNVAMLDLQPDIVLAFQNRASRGTQHTINEARARGIETHVFTEADVHPEWHAGAR